MLPTENLFFLGSIYFFTVQAQVQTDVNCDLFPSNPLCSLTQIKRLSVLDHPLPPPERALDWKPNHGGLDFGREEIPPPPLPPHRGPNFRPNNLSTRPHRVPVVPRPKRPLDTKPSGSNRQKRFFFWYNPADILQAKMNLWKTKVQHFTGESPPSPPPPRRPIILPYDEYDCVHGKLVQGKPLDNNGYYSHNNVKQQGVYHLANGQPVILASPIVLSPKEHQLGASQTKHVRAKKKPKPAKYEVEMEEEESEESNEASRYIRDHAPQYSEESEDSDDSSAEKRERKDRKRKDKIKSEFEISPNGERIEFQVQGHNGPKTYIFGFDTGDGKNRQYRLEERQKDGTVKGQYGYYDAKGKLRTIKYVARPMEGYQEKHHEVNLSDLT